MLAAQSHQGDPSPREAAALESSVPLAPRAGDRLTILDGARALAVSLVFIFHCTLLNGMVEKDAQGLWRTQLHGLDALFARLTFLNGLAPVLFFALSGFLITGILRGTRDHPRYFQNFYGRRALRILPLYYAVVFVALIILPHFDHAKAASFGRIQGDEWMYWLLLTNFSVAKAEAFRHGILDVTWSLSVEEQFYLVWPLLVYFLSRRALIWVCLGMYVFANCFRTYMAFGEHSHPLPLYVLTWARLGAISLGSLLGIVWRNPGLLDRLKRPAAFFAAATIPVIWIVIGVEEWAGKSVFPATGVRGGPYSRTILDAFTGLGLVGFLITCLTVSPTSLLSRIFTSAPARILSKYSYGIFLFHLPTRALIRDLIFGPHKQAWDPATGVPLVVRQPYLEWPRIFESWIPAQLLFYVIAFACTFPLAFLSWHLFEKHFLYFKKYFKYDGPRTAPAGTPEIGTRNAVFPAGMLILGLVLIVVGGWLRIWGSNDWNFTSLNMVSPGILALWFGLCGLFDRFTALPVTGAIPPVPEPSPAPIATASTARRTGGTPGGNGNGHIAPSAGAAPAPTPSNPS